LSDVSTDRLSHPSLYIYSRVYNPFSTLNYVGSDCFDWSLHIGWWQRYFHELFLLRDTCAGAPQLISNPEVQLFFKVIDDLFMLIDRDLCHLYRAVTPPEQRICGSSFLMAVINHGGTGHHADWMDFREGC